MSKKLLMLFATLVAAAALGSCNKDNSVISTAPAPVPTGTSATVTALYQGNDLNNQPIYVYNTNGSTSNPQPSGAAIFTQNTNSSGQTTFTGLTSGAYYCFQYQYTINSSTTTTQTYCGNAWAAGVQLGS